jgi:hypothetical protein
MMVVGFLQNAWSPLYSGGLWPRDSWLKALFSPKCRSGQRLKLLIKNCPSVNFWFDNTTPIVGSEPDSVVKPNIDHMKKVIGEQKPSLVIGFGKQAEISINKIATVIPCLFLPHPACRTLKNEVYINAATQINFRLNEIY